MPSRFYAHGGIEIILGDCREVLTMLARADLVLSDPPYGHGEKWSGGTWAANQIYDAVFEWDATPITTSAMEQLIKAGERAIVWGGNYYTMPPSRCWLAWEKSSKLTTLADFELAWTNLDRPAKLFREQRNPDGKREHPTQKPLSLMMWWLSLASGGTVIDPYMGSGTTALACKQLGRRFVGIEINEAYCELAARRLEQEMLPFDPVAPEPARQIALID